MDQAHGFVYAIGGIVNSPLGSVERATIDENGNVGTFSLVADVSLDTPRHSHTSVVAGGFLYVIGGNDGSVSLSSVERAVIQPNGTLGTFTTVGGVSLITKRETHSSVVLGNLVYVIGGVECCAGPSSFELDRLEKATFDEDGSLGPFTAVGNSKLGFGREEHVTAVVGQFLYVVGGRGNVGTFQKTIERAPILMGGVVGDFSNQTQQLVRPRKDANHFLTNDALLVVGGSDGNSDFSTVERATLE